VRLLRLKGQSRMTLVQPEWSQALTGLAPVNKFDDPTAYGPDIGDAVGMGDG
jgi:hypothetical protein